MRWIEQHTYSNRIRKLHPAYKAGLAFLVLIVCLLTTNYFISFICFVGIFALTVIWARIPITVFLKLILSEGSFLFIAILGVAVSVTFHPSIGAYRVGNLWLNITAASVNLALVIFFRALGSAAALNFLILTTPVSDLIYLARKVHVPEFLMDIVIIMYRFIFVLYDSLERMVLAQQIRLGFSNFKSSWRSIANIAAQLFIEALQRSRRLNLALQGRGWDGTLKVLNPRFEHPLLFRLLWGMLVK